MSFICFSALSITVFRVEAKIGKGHVFFEVFLALFSELSREKRLLWDTDILDSKEYKKKKKGVRIDEVIVGSGHFHHSDSFSLFI